MEIKATEPVNTEPTGSDLKKWLKLCIKCKWSVNKPDGDKVVNWLSKDREAGL